MANRSAVNTKRTTKGGGKFSFLFFEDPETENMPLEELDLSNRSVNALGRAGITTVGQLIENWGKIKNVRNLGESSVKEIRAKVFAYNLNRIFDNDKKMQAFADSIHIIRA